MPTIGQAALSIPRPSMRVPARQAFSRANELDKVRKAFDDSIANRFYQTCHASRGKVRLSRRDGKLARANFDKA